MTSETGKPRLTADQWKSNDVGELEALLEKHGPEAIRIVREIDPGAYIRAIARLVEDLD